MGSNNLPPIFLPRPTAGITRSRRECLRVEFSGHLRREERYADAAGHADDQVFLCKGVEVYSSASMRLKITLLITDRAIGTDEDKIGV